MGSGAMQPLWNRLHEIRKPVFLVAGKDDPKYAELAVRMAGLLPDAHVELVPSAGHAVHLEHPRAFVDALEHFARSS
jgi:pimeloyl-ACP methyl ester carboxylesterase